MNVQQEKVSTLRDFKIILELGKGSFSQVYRVKRIADGQEYALKKVHLGLLKEKEKKNALNEVRLLASIHDQHIVAYKDAFLDDSLKYLCIVMELLPGGDVYHRISQAIKGGPQFAEPEIWRALVHITLGLKALHDQKIVHRDLKSANVFLSADGIFKLGDLNVSKVAKQGFVYTQTGTPYYASPEVWRDDPYDMKSDMWSLGCLIYEMCCLQTPFRAKEMDVLYQKVQKGVYEQIPSKYSKDLAQIISLLLKPSASQRPNCDQLLQNPILQNHMMEIDLVTTQPQNYELLQTIQIPKTIDQLRNHFPKSNYENSIEKINDNKSTENSTSPFRSSQQNTKTVQDSRVSYSQLNDRQQTEIIKNYSYLGRDNKHPLLVEGPRPLVKKQPPQSAQQLNRLPQKDKISLPDVNFIEQKLQKLKQSQKLRDIREKNLQIMQNLKDIQELKSKEALDMKSSWEAQSKLIRENKLNSISRNNKELNSGNYKLQLIAQPKSLSPISRSVEPQLQQQPKLSSNQVSQLAQANQFLNNENQIKSTVFKSNPSIRRKLVPQSACPSSYQYSSNNSNNQRPTQERYVHPQSALPQRTEQQKIDLSSIFPLKARVLKSKLPLNNQSNFSKNDQQLKLSRPLSSNVISKDRYGQLEQQPNYNLITQNYNHYYPIENYQRHSSDQNLIKLKLRQQEMQSKLQQVRRNMNQQQN